MRVTYESQKGTYETIKGVYMSACFVCLITKGSLQQQDFLTEARAAKKLDRLAQDLVEGASRTLHDLGEFEETLELLDAFSERDLEFVTDSRVFRCRHRHRQTLTARAGRCLLPSLFTVNASAGTKDLCHPYGAVFLKSVPT